MTHVASTPRPLEVIAFTGANARSYLSAVFAAYRGGKVVLAMPAGTDRKSVPGTKVLTQQSFDPDPGWFDETLSLSADENPAQIAFSSGTTGQPKALLLSHRALSDVVSRINTAMQVDNTIREYIGVPVTYSFGFGRARAVAAAGGKSYLPPNGFDPSEIGRMLVTGEINAVSAVPTLWRVVLSNSESVTAGAAQLQWIEIGSQYMSGTEKQALKELFPNARIVQHYGLTEASRSTLLDISATSGAALESVGPVTDRVSLSPDGLIRLRGPHLSDGLITGAGIKPLVDASGWMTTSDRGRIEDGYLYYAGRADELINCGGVKIDPTRFEQALGAELGTPQGIAVGREADPLRGERVLVVAEAAAELDMDKLQQATLKIAKEHGLQGTGTFVLRQVTEIPRTATGKIQRAELAGLEDVTVATPSQHHTLAPTSRATELQALWAEVLNTPHVSLHESFYDLGGDSLSALTVIMRMEALGLDPETARMIFDGKTIAEIVGQMPATDPVLQTAPPPEPPADGVSAPNVPRLTLTETINSLNALRGFLVWFVVFSHWMPGILLRLSEDLVWIYQSLIPVLRFGTPGFALVFGIGIGALGIAQYQKHPDQFKRRMWFNAKMIFAGILLLACFRFGILWSHDELGSPLLASKLFYSAIAFYALAMLLLPSAMTLLTAGQSRLLTLVGLTVSAMVVHEILSATIGPLALSGIPELAKILLSAKYGLFRMATFVLVGVIIGYLVRQNYDTPGLYRKLAAWGVITATLGVVLLYEVAPGAMLSHFGRVMPWHLMIYAGVAILMLSGIMWLNVNGGQNQSGAGVRVVNVFFITSGLLGLPIFVGHELVIPAKSLLEALGLPGSVALLIPLALLFAAVFVGYKKFFRVLL